MGRPVVALGVDASALGDRFQVIGLDEAKGLEGVGVLAASAHCAEALAAAEALSAKVLVLVSPQGVDPDALKALACAKCVLIGSEDAAQGPDALAKWRGAGASAVLVWAAGPDIAADRPGALASAAGDFLERQGRFAFMTQSVAVG